MAMKKWAMVIMNAGYDPEKDMRAWTWSRLRHTSSR